MYRESCQAAASHLKEGVLGLRVPLGNDIFGLFDGAPDVVLCGSESYSDEVMVVVIMVVEEQFLPTYPYLPKTIPSYLPYL